MGNQIALWYNEIIFDDIYFYLKGYDGYLSETSYIYSYTSARIKQELTWYAVYHHQNITTMTRQNIHVMAELI